MDSVALERFIMLRDDIRWRHPAGVKKLSMRSLIRNSAESYPRWVLADAAFNYQKFPASDLSTPFDQEDDYRERKVPLSRQGKDHRLHQALLPGV